MTDPTVRAIRPDTGVKLAALRLPELQALAAELGISGASKLRKGELVDTISEIQTAVGASSPAQNDDAAQAETAPAAPAAPKKRAPRRATATAGVVTTTVRAPEPETVPDAVQAAPSEAGAVSTGAVSTGAETNGAETNGAETIGADSASADTAEKPAGRGRRASGKQAAETAAEGPAAPADDVVPSEALHAEQHADDGSEESAPNQRSRSRNRNRGGGDRQQGDRQQGDRQ
ncbi:MAG TPA: Rho termination factor N-terminal domain-containing protein, partial [Terrimesophilobacter sp.]